VFRRRAVSTVAVMAAAMAAVMAAIMAAVMAAVMAAILASAMAAVMVISLRIKKLAIGSKVRACDAALPIA
jgi:hypothetical protein